jgi:hypothetical protein
MHSFRLSPDLLRRLDAYAARIRKRYPGMRVTRADALRSLLERALADDSTAEQCQHEASITITEGRAKKSSPRSRSRPRPSSA